MPVIWATPAMADDIVDAQVALDSGNALVVDLTIQHDLAVAVVTSAEEEVISAQASLDAVDQTVETISNSVSDLQTTYDTQVITSVTYTDNALTATVYSDPGYNNAPPLGAGAIVKTQPVAQINFQWGGGSVLAGPSEDVQIKFEGTITAPETKEYSFYGPADDGFILKINGETIINDWYDKGGGGSVSPPVLLTAGVANAFEAWYYENGGGAWVQLNWYDNGWRVVPATAFDTPQVVETKDPNVLILLNNAKTDLELAEASQVAALADLNSAIEVYNDALEAKNVVYANLESAIAAIPTLQQNLTDVVEAKRIADEQAAEAARLAEQARLEAIAAQEAAARAAAEARAIAEAKARAEAEALAAEQARIAEEARIAAEKAAAEAAIAKAKAEEEARLAAEKAAQEEADRIAAEALAAQQLAEAAQAEAERLAAEQAAQEEAERLAVERANQLIPSPEPSPEATPEPEKQSPEEDMSNIETVDLKSIDPETLTTAQVEELVSAAEEVLSSSEQGSPEYEKALEALAVAAEADDPQLPAELAAIPGAAAVMEAFNNLGNVGADMAPAVREEAEKTVIATVIAAGAAINAVQSATTAAASAAATASGSSGTTGGSSGGSSSGSSARRKE